MSKDFRSSGELEQSYSEPDCPVLLDLSDFPAIDLLIIAQRYVTLRFSRHMLKQWD
jgi:hypothetical protein